MPLPENQDGEVENPPLPESWHGAKELSKNVHRSGYEKAAFMPFFLVSPHKDLGGSKSHDLRGLPPKGFTSTGVSPPPPEHLHLPKDKPLPHQSHISYFA